MIKIQVNDMQQHFVSHDQRGLENYIVHTSKLAVISFYGLLVAFLRLLPQRIRTIH